jgi:hypothetical protein
MKKTITAWLLAICLLLPAICFTTACSTVSDWAEDHPAEANLAKAGLLTGLNYFLANNPDYSAYEAPLRGAIQFALSEAQSAEEAAALLDSQSLAILDDPDVRASLLAAWQAQLDRSTLTPEGAPAAGPQHDYARTLANSLRRAEVGKLRPEAPSTQVSGLRSQAYKLGTNYTAPAWAESRWGGHWSDPLWQATAWFSGCDSYASFRAWHSTPAEPEIQEQWNDRHEALQLAASDREI